MTASTEEIERIVRAVMAKLGGSLQTVTPPRAVAPPPIASLPDSPAAREGELSIDCRVVTLEAIAGRLKGAKQLTVAPGALVTPSVCDELRRKGISLIRGSRATAGMSLPRALLVVGRTRHDPAAVVQTLAKEGIDVQTETSECMIAATDKLATVAVGHALGLLWTRHTAIGLCLANRHSGVRAVLAAGVSATAVSVAAVGANVLIVDPTIGSEYEKKQIVRDFCLGGIRECPEALKERLGR